MKRKVISLILLAISGDNSPDAMGVLRAAGGILAAILSCVLIRLSTKIFPGGGWATLMVMIVLVSFSSLLIGFMGSYLSSWSTGREDV